MKVASNNTVIADAPKEELIYIEGNWYFPPSSVKQDWLRKSPRPYTCPWKGVCQYFDVGHGDHWQHDYAWSYPAPKPSAIKTVGKDFSNYVAFDKRLEVTE